MLRMTLAAAAALTATVTEAMAMDVQSLDTVDLDALRWQARPVVVLADDGDARLAQQLALFDRDEAALTDRDMIVLTGSPDTAGRLAEGVDGFAVLLIGKDGGIKARHDAVVDPSELIALVDTMPMRRGEAAGE